MPSDYVEVGQGVAEVLLARALAAACSTASASSALTLRLVCTCFNLDRFGAAIKENTM